MTGVRNLKQIRERQAVLALLARISPILAASNRASVKLNDGSAAVDGVAAIKIFAISVSQNNDLGRQRAKEGEPERRG